MAKKLKLKVPKRIGGMKIPKTVRKGPLADFLNSSGGQVLIAEALVLAAGAFASKRLDPESHAGELVHHAVDSAKGAAPERLVDASTRFSHAFREGIEAFRTSLHESERHEESEPHDDDEVGTEAFSAESESAKKKPSSSDGETLSTPH